MRSIWVCSAAAAAAFAFAPAALAHVEVEPRRADANSVVRIALTAENESPGGPITEVTITLPEGFRLVSLEPRAPWASERFERILRFTGGGIPLGGDATFRFSGRVGDDDARFDVSERHDDGSTNRYAAVIDVRSEGRSAWVIAGVVVAAALVLGAFAFGLARWLRGGAPA